MLASSPLLGELKGRVSNVDNAVNNVRKDVTDARKGISAVGRMQSEGFEKWSALIVSQRSNVNVGPTARASQMDGGSGAPDFFWSYCKDSALLQWE
eukprot:8780667-Karenia_brevis.AAC.1